MGWLAHAVEHHLRNAHLYTKEDWGNTKMRKALSMLLTLAMTTTLMAPTSYALADDAVDRAVLYGLEEDEPYTDDATDPMPGDRLLGDNGYEDEPAVPVPGNTSNTRTFSIAPEDDYNNSYDSYLGAQDDTDPAPSSDPVGTGVIKVDSGLISRDTTRNNWQYGKKGSNAGSIGWLGVPRWTNAAVELLDASGTVIRSGTGGKLSFEELPAGTYTVPRAGSASSKPHSTSHTALST